MIISRCAVVGLIVLGATSVLMVRSAWPTHPHPKTALDRGSFHPRYPRLDVSGYSAIAEVVKPWRADATLPEIAREWHDLGHKGIAIVDANSPLPICPSSAISSSCSRKRPSTFMKVNPKRRTRRWLFCARRSRAIRGPRVALATVIFMQGVCAMRRGENDNCIACRGESSCIVPISAAAVHLNRTGSLLAVKHFKEYLDLFPGDLGVRWLLQIAHQTLGETADDGDPAFRCAIQSTSDPTTAGSTSSPPRYDRDARRRRQGPLGSTSLPEHRPGCFGTRAGFREITQAAGLDKVCARMGCNSAISTTTAGSTSTWARANPIWPRWSPTACSRTSAAGVSPTSPRLPAPATFERPRRGLRRLGPRRDIDMFVETGGAVNGDKYHNVLFQNPGQGNHWLTVKLVGKKTNRAAIGAGSRWSRPAAPLTIYRHRLLRQQLRGQPAATNDRPGRRQERRNAGNPLADQSHNPGLPRNRSRPGHRDHRVRRQLPPPRLEKTPSTPLSPEPARARPSSRRPRNRPALRVRNRARAYDVG